MGGQISSLGVFFSAFMASCTAGVAAYLRSGKTLSWLALVTAGLNSGLLGLSIALLWYQKFQDNIYFLVGVCVITGLTGAAGLDFLLTAIQKGGFEIKIGGGKDDKGNLSLDLGMSEKEKSDDIQRKK